MNKHIHQWHVWNISWCDMMMFWTHQVSVWGSWFLSTMSNLQPPSNFYSAGKTCLELSFWVISRVFDFSVTPNGGHSHKIIATSPGSARILCPKWRGGLNQCPSNYYVCCAYETQPWQSKVWNAEGNWPGQHHQSHIFAQVLWACVLVQMLQMSTVTQQLHHLCWMSCLLLLSHLPWTPTVVSLTSLGQTAAMITTSEATSIFSFLETICNTMRCHLFWKNCNNSSLHTHFTLDRLWSILWVTPLRLFPHLRHWRYYIGCTLFTNPQYLTWGPLCKWQYFDWITE